MKRFASLLVFLLIFALSLNIFAAGEEFTASTSGICNVEFSNGFIGFCIDQEKDGAYSGDVYIESSDTSLAKNNDDESDISQYLKILFTQQFNSIFVSDGNGSYVVDSGKASSSLQSAIWNLSDGWYVYGEGKNFVTAVKAYDGPSIPDSGYTLTLENGDVVAFYFTVMQSKDSAKQDYFAYKIDVTSPGAHQHVYRTTWSFDEENHWRECECGDKTEMDEHTGGTADCKNLAVCETCQQPYGLVNSENHTGETEVRDYKDATTEAPGYTGDTYCKDCGALLEEGSVIPQLHQHVYRTTWSFDAENHWRECECGDKIEMDEHTGGTADCKNLAVCETCLQPYGLVNSENHTGETEVRNYKEATTEAPGYTGDTYCKDCGNLFEEGSVIPQLHQHVYNTDWSFDEENHWRECECGDKTEMDEHTGGTADCKNLAVCETCLQPYGLVNSENHTGETEVRNYKEATTEAPGYTGDTYCKDCGNLFEEGSVIPQLHQHVYNTDWSFDEENHWRECECGDKTEMDEHTGGTADCKNLAVCETCQRPYGLVNSENHTGETEVRDYKEATTEAPGYTGDTYCKDCGNLLEEGSVIPQLHQHVYNTDWSFDEENHWRECECGDKTEMDEHTGGTADCKNLAVCETCQQPYGLVNSENHIGETEVRDYKDATTEAPGYTGDTYCKDCGNLLEEGSVIPQLHKHLSMAKWFFDNDGHWEECECGEITAEKTMHEFDNKNDAECKCGFEREIKNTSDSNRPSDNSKPSSENKSEEDKTSNIPDTGDNTDVFGWLCLMFCSFIWLTNLIIIKKRYFNS